MMTGPILWLYMVAEIDEVKQSGTPDPIAAVADRHRVSRNDLFLAWSRVHTRHTPAERQDEIAQVEVGGHLTDC